MCAKLNICLQNRLLTLIAISQTQKIFIKLQRNLVWQVVFIIYCVHHIGNSCACFISVIVSLFYCKCTCNTTYLIRNKWKYIVTLIYLRFSLFYLFFIIYFRERNMDCCLAYLCIFIGSFFFFFLPLRSSCTQIIKSNCIHSYNRNLVLINLPHSCNKSNIS